MGSAPPTSAGLPLLARRYIALVVAGSLVVVAGALWQLPAHLTGGTTIAWYSILVFVFCLVIHSRSFTLSWRGQHISISPDEAVLLAAFVYLPAPIVVLVALAASVAAQAIVRKPLVKLTFTSSVYALSVGLAAVFYTLGLALGLEGLQAAILVPLVVSAVSHVLVAILLTLLSGEPLPSFIKPELTSSIVVSAVAGITLGFLALALVGFHPVAAVLIVPIGMAFYRAMAGEYRHQNELAARRALSRVSERLVGESSEDAIMESVFAACRDAFALREVHVTLRRSEAEERTWSAVEHVKDDRPVARVGAPLVDKQGNRIGEIALVVAATSSTRHTEDQELAGLIGGYLSIALGTSDALRSLQEAEQRLRDVYDAARDPILILEEDGGIVFHNNVARDLLRLPARPAPMPPLDRILDSTSMERLREWLSTHHDEAGVVEVVAFGREREHLHLEFSLSPIGLGGGRVGTLVLGRDVTERRRLEREATAQRDAISRNERLAALGILVAGVAHEVNNPLAFMRSNLELALGDVADAERDMREAALVRADVLAETKQGLEATLHGVDRIARITKALKVVARKGLTERDVMDLNEVALSVEELVKGSVPSGVTLRFESAPGPLTVRGNAAEIHQVLLNLTRNALEAVAAKGGEVVVSTTQGEGHASVTVKDDGPGIEAKVRAQLFTPFLTTKPQGTGLGLSIAHTIVKEHGGEITVETEPGRGAAFTIRFPSSSEEAPIAESTG